LRDFSNSRLFTVHVLTDEDSVIRHIANAMKLQCYDNYYCLDAVLFDEHDVVRASPQSTTACVRRVRVAFEHENDFNSGLFQEVCHLLITDCDLRVLVSYPENPEDLKYQLDFLHKVIKGTGRSQSISETSSFLFIVDTLGKTTLKKWQAFVYRSAAWKKLAA